MNWIKIGGIAFVIMFLIGSHWVAFKKGGDLRQAEIMAKIGATNAAAAETAKRGMGDAAKKLQNETDSIISFGPDGDGPLAPVLLHTVQLNRVSVP